MMNKMERERFYAMTILQRDIEKPLIDRILSAENLDVNTASSLECGMAIINYQNLVENGDDYFWLTDFERLEAVERRNLAANS